MLCSTLVGEESIDKEKAIAKIRALKKENETFKKRIRELETELKN